MKKKLDKSDKKSSQEFWTLFVFWALSSIGWVGGSTAYDLLTGDGWSNLVMNIVAGPLGATLVTIVFYRMSRSK